MTQNFPMSNFCILSITAILGIVGAIAKWAIPAVLGYVGYRAVKKATGNVGKFLSNASQSLGQGISNIGQSAGSHLESFANQITGNALTGAQVQANDFSAEQAQIQRDWQTEMDNTRYQRTVSDMQAAGVNPALAIGQGASASAPSGASAASVSPSAAASMSELMAMLRLPMEIKQMKSQLKLNDAEVALRESQAALNRSETGLVDKRVSAFDALTQSQLDDIYSAIERRDVQNALDKQGISESQAREALQLQQAMQTAIDNETRGELNRLSIEYKRAQTALANAELGKTKAETHKLYKDCEHIQAQIAELFQRSILHAAQANYLDESARNLMVQHNILQYDEKAKEFQVDHQKLTYWVDTGSKVIGAATGVLMAGSAATATGRLAPALRASSQGMARYHSQYNTLYPYD